MLLNLAKIKNTFEPLSEGNVRLRLLSQGDLRTTLAWRNRDDIRHQFIHSDIITWENHLFWWERYQSKSDDFVFIIEETDKLKRPVGQTSLYNIDLVQSEAEYGRLMIGDPEARGKGVAIRAAAIVESWAFNRLSLKRLYCTVFKTNTTARNLNEKCGFAICGEHDDLYIMHLSNQDYFKGLNRTFKSL